MLQTGIRDAVVEGGLRRVRPAMMTTATTILALLPVLTSTGRGSDIMLPMAIPSFGGMTLQMITMFTVPVLYSLWQEWGLRINNQFGDNTKSIKITTVALLIFAAGLTTVNAQSPENLIQEAVTNNLELKILEKEYLTALEKAPQVSQLPDPEVGVGVFPLPVETRLGPQIIRIGATQMLPWKGILDSKKELELAKAKTLYERIGASTLELSYQVKQAWYSLYEIEQSQTIIQRNLGILESLDRLALAKIESGKATGADVLRVQLKIEELKQELTILETAKAKPTSTINQLLNRDLGILITINDSLSFAIMPFQKDSLAASIRANHPMIRMFALQQEVAQKALALNKLDGKPSFGVGLDYIMVNKRGDADPSRNGRDIVQLRASVKIPLFRQKYEAKEREEELKIATLDHKKEDVVSRFMAMIDKAYTDYEIAQLRINLYEKQITITQSAINILESNYSAKGNGFDELLRLEKELIDYDLKILKAVVQSHQAKIRIEKFLFSN